MKKNKKHNSLNLKIVITLLSVSVFVFIFKSDIVDLLTPEINGCMDPLASNYDPLASIDDDSCKYNEALPNHLKEAIEAFKNEKWDKDNYLLLRDKIKIHFSSLNELGSRNEISSLQNLDLAYMIVLNSETKKIVKNCFISDKKLAEEVYSFYKKYKKENDEIKNAQYLFSKKNQILRKKSKVNNLLAMEYVKDEFDLLVQEINDFKNLAVYKEFEKCNNLKQIIFDAEKDLSDFKDISIQFKIWKRNIKNDFSAVKVDDYTKFQYSKYKWYNEQILAEDRRLKERERVRQEKIKQKLEEQKRKANLELK